MVVPKEITFISQIRAEAYNPKPSDAIISIVDSNKPQASFGRGWCAELRLAFDDVDPVNFPVESDEGLVEMQPQQAEQVAAFMLSLPEGCESIVVHCRYGQSRSAGVAKALCEYFGLPFPSDYDGFNSYVFTRVREALRVKVRGEPVSVDRNSG
ncbi:hypothetical protein R5W24_006349 [Gemmata sp. JC717]|uniref:hypothetical protein n=1 Tax=Gemmata algarum TaxID=2975278 RepID=UPI0021BAF5F9|nr:hypothetical protein [Gemmata algarum]MDY3557162.1 hypothetical protein [Gemmata algarum]